MAGDWNSLSGIGGGAGVENQSASL